MRSARAGWLSLFLGALVIGLLGCSRLKPAAKAPPTLLGAAAPAPLSTSQPSAPEVPALQVPTAAATKPAPLTHKVLSAGETLFAIARWYTGAGENWPRIAKANSIHNPRHIRVGDTILIPPDLLITRRPMPIITSSRPAHKKKARLRKPEKSSAKQEGIELFGPVEKNPQRMAPEKDDLPLEKLDPH